jgi:hypothetical protein
MFLRPAAAFAHGTAAVFIKPERIFTEVLQGILRGIADGAGSRQLDAADEALTVVVFLVII